MTMTFTPHQIDLRQRHRTTLDTARALTTLQEQALRADLPVLDWQVSEVGLVGRPPAFSTPDRAEQAFHAWAAHLGRHLQVEEPVQRHAPTPVRVLSARGRVPHPQASAGTVRVMLLAEIDLDPMT